MLTNSVWFNQPNTVKCYRRLFGGRFLRISLDRIQAHTPCSQQTHEHLNPLLQPAALHLAPTIIEYPLMRSTEKPKSIQNLNDDLRSICQPNLEDAFLYSLISNRFHTSIFWKYMPISSPESKLFPQVKIVPPSLKCFPKSNYPMLRSKIPRTTSFRLHILYSTTGRGAGIGTETARTTSPSPKYCNTQSLLFPDIYINQ